MAPECTPQYLEDMEGAAVEFLSTISALPMWQRQYVYRAMGLRATRALRHLARTRLDHIRSTTPLGKVNAQ